MDNVAMTEQLDYLCMRDYRLGKLIHALGILQYGEKPTAFESICHSIIEQMMSRQAALTIEDRLRDLCNGDIAPLTVSRLTIEELRKAGMSYRKAKTLLHIAQTTDEDYYERLCRMDGPDIATELQRFSGIGKWTTDMFLLFYIEEPDILPIEDGAFRQAFCWLYSVESYIPPVIDVITSLWQPYSSLAARYLYRALNIGWVKSGPAADVLNF